MPGLTAKVFRTYNASATMQDELAKWNDKDTNIKTSQEKVLFFGRASAQVAILCNHRRTAPKNFSMEKIDSQIKEEQEYLEELKEHIKNLKAGKTPKDRGEENKRNFPTNIESTEKAITRVEEIIKNLEIKMTEKDEGKEVYLTTSKINYTDPRISLAWCKKVNLDCNKIFSLSLKRKFDWAIGIVDDDPDFVF